MVYLVRHGDAGSKAEWDGPDLARPLSETGRRQAAGLVARLRRYPVHRILSSPADRCRQTVQPLASRLRLAVEVTDLLYNVPARLKFMKSERAEALGRDACQAAGVQWLDQSVCVKSRMRTVLSRATTIISGMSPCRAR